MESSDQEAKSSDQGVLQMADQTAYRSDFTAKHFNGFLIQYQGPILSTIKKSR